MIPGNINTDLISGADEVGYQVTRSLRFNSSDSAFLSRTPASAGNRKTWTWAGWVKRCTLGSLQFLFTGTLSGSGGNSSIAFNSDDTIYFRYLDAAASFTTTAVFRDPSAWYHIVAVADTDNATANDRLAVYVNGVRQLGTISAPTLGQSNGYINFNNVHFLGTQSTTYSNFYLADIHFIDGQALTPSSFAETNATTGQWVPKAYTGSYGTNGFWLDFSDNSAATATTLGKDYSGNNNNWTPNNLSVQGGNGSYVGSVAGTPYNASYPISNMFDGNTGTSYLSGSGTTTWTPALPISFTKFRGNIYQDSGSVNITFNWSGGSYVFTATSTSAPGGWIDFTANLGGPITSISWPSGSATGPYIYAWEVNDQVLVDYRLGAGNDSLVDTPTSGSQVDTGLGGQVTGNYATLNPLAATAGTFSNGNLQLATVLSGYPIYTATQYTPAGTGKWYWEFTIDSQTGTNYTMLGMLPSDSTYKIGQNGTPYSFGGIATYIGYNGVNNAASGAATASGTPTATITTGDIVGWAFDAANGTVVIYKNGVSQGTCYTNVRTTVGWTFAFSDYDNSSASTVTVNFGQRPFAYTAPSGFKALCDTNLPAPVVAKPSEVMDVKLYTGNGSTQTISGLGFSPDLVWIKSRSVGYYHNLLDTIRGNTVRLASNVTDVEDYGSAGGATPLFSSFNSDGFSMPNNVNVNGNGTTYAAWCWDAGSSTVTNTDGSITSQVRANASAGFSIVTYTGNVTYSTIGHGLGIRPSLIIVKSRTGTTNWAIYHSSLGASAYLYFNTAAVATDNVMWQGVSPTSSVFSVGNYNENNGSNTYVAYCFAPVAGYSAMGSYVGNASSTDGPFCWCGFKPRFLLVKASNLAVSWQIYDSARNTYNLTDNELYPDRSDAENAQGVSGGIDFLSSGFKIKSGDSWLNNNNTTYIYFAIAESPFQYARAR